jgi:hypothetical protein
MRAVRPGSWLHDGLNITEIVRPNVDTPKFSRKRDNGLVMSNTCETRITITKEHEPQKTLVFAVRPLGPSSVWFLYFCLV